MFALPTYGFVVSIFALVGAGLVRCATERARRRRVPHPLAGGRGRGHRFRRPCARSRRARPRSRVSRRSRTASTRSAGRTAGTPRRRSSSSARSRSRCSSASRGSPSTCTHGRRRPARRPCSREIARARVPVLVGARVHVLGRADADARRARARREHVVSGLPAPRRAARARPFLRTAVHEPRRPARLLERDRRPDGDRNGAARGCTTRASTR